MRYEIRAMSIGEILDAGFRLLRDHFVLLVGIASIFQVPLTMLSYSFQPAPGEPFEPGDLLGLIVIAPLAYAVLSPLAVAATTFAIGQSYRGIRTGIGESLRCAFRIFLPLIGTSIIAALIQLAGLLFFIIPGIYLYLAFLLLQTVMVLERVFGFSALTRSHDLMKGQKLRGFALVVVAGILFAVVGGIFSLAAGYLPVVGTVVAGLANGVGYAFLASVMVLLYFDIRCRKEQFDLEYLAQLVEVGSGGAGTPGGGGAPERPAPVA